MSHDIGASKAAPVAAERPDAGHGSAAVGRSTLASALTSDEPASSAAPAASHAPPAAAPPPSAGVQLSRLHSLFGSPRVQLSGAGTPAGVDVVATAQAGVSGGGGALPHRDAIQRSFGPEHDVSGIGAHVGGAAASAASEIGAAGYAIGDQVAFRDQPSLHLAAHEAAHVVQQRAGVQLSGGVGQAGDAYERHADAVADRVVAGQSAADLLGPARGGGIAVQAAPAVQRDATGLRVGGGQLITDWATAVAQIGTLYTGVSTGVAWQKNRGVDLWYEQARADDPPPVWQDILINAVGFAAAAGVAGYGAVLTARVVTSAASATLRAAVAAGIDAGKNVAKSAASAAVSAAMRTGGSDGRLVFREGLKNDIDRATTQESDTVAAGLSGLSSAADSEKWPGLQALYDQIHATAAQALDIQHGSATEAWMSASAQHHHGVDFSIGGTTLTGMYRAGTLTLLQMQSIRSYLQVNPDLSRLPPEHQGALQRALGANWASMPVQRVTDAEAVASSGTGALSPTSTTGVLELHLNTTVSGGQAADPTVSYAEIESSHGINEATRNYFLNSSKKVEDFAVPKLLIGSDFRMAFDEANSAGLRTTLTGAPSDWLNRYAARRLGMTYDPANRQLFETSAIAFLRADLLGRTLAQLGVRTIGR